MIKKISEFSATTYLLWLRVIPLVSCNRLSSTLIGKSHFYEMITKDNIMVVPLIFPANIRCTCYMIYLHYMQPTKLSRVISNLESSW